MSAISLAARGSGLDGGHVSRLDGEMVELAFLLPSWQADALEVAARDQGLTSGQMIRQLVRDFCDTTNAFGHLHLYRRAPAAGGPGA